LEITRLESSNPWKLVDREVTNYNDAQYTKEYESTKFTRNCLSEILDLDDQLTVLDVGCSAGANLYHLAKEYVSHSFIGIDINDFFLNQAIDIHSELGIKNTRFEVADFKDHSPKYDIIGSCQFLVGLGINDGIEFQDYCFQNSQKGVYFLSTFSNREIDWEIYAHDYTYDPHKIVPQCQYSIPRLVKKAKEYGFKLKKKEQFIIDIDLPDKWEGRGTYTRKDEDSNRMMFTDMLHLQWYFIYFEKE